MNLFICIDDTDVIGSKGTGEIAEEIGAELQRHKMGVASAVSRHQLYVHNDIPYTSHNSAMCFELTNVAPNHQQQVITLCIDYLKQHSAVGSDPGLAVADEQSHWDELIKFGLKAKKEVLTKQAAYQLAQRCGVHLSEHGGTGDGIIGALAGLGLRKQGSDGRLKGQIRLQDERTQISVAELRNQPMIDAVVDLNHSPLADHHNVHLSGKIKTVRLQSQSTLLVYQDPFGAYHNASRQQLKDY